MTTSSTSFVMVLFAALACLHVASAGAAVPATCDDRHVKIFGTCSSVTDPSICNQAVTLGGAIVCQWNGISCENSPTEASCETEFESGVNCGPNFVGNCASAFSVEDCTSSRTFSGSCNWVVPFNSCSESGNACN